MNGRVAFKGEVMSRAVDLTECPNYPRACRCKPFCEVCGNRKHVSLHGPIYGEPAGTKPYDHEYTPRDLSTKRTCGGV
jgi:hypothetical protein